jgi:NAD(P) transhydrogenase subunit alpha
MRIGIPRETLPGETRVALTPGTVPPLLKDGHDVLVEAGAGAAAHFPDAQYSHAGARIVETADALYDQADAVFKVQPPVLELGTGRKEMDMLREGSLCIGLLAPLTHPELVAAFTRRHITSYALELIPRISRAQSMDALTSMATVAGYKAVLLAADRLDKLFPLMMTAAGTVAPATVLVLGAGVAGLQAIATAHRLGARVVAFDPRPVVREQVQSLGARFLEIGATEAVESAGGYAREQSTAFLEAERAVIAERLPEMDVVICTAQVFGKRAPLLITADMVARLRPGAVIVDLAADQGGNCELTEPGHELDRDGVLVIGAGDLPTHVPADASQMYAHNVVSLFRYLYPAHGSPPDSTDEIVREACVTRDGAIVSATVRSALREGVSA